MDGETGLIDARIDPAQGCDLRERYNAASPFPHVVIDDFLPPSILEACLADFPGAGGAACVQFDRAQERGKTHFNPDSLSARARGLFYSFNSLPFIRVLENITGITGLIPDPYFLGAGFHEIKQGGHLSVHADFNYHRQINLERRINVLIYLNKDWKPEYGGQLEFWTSGMSERAESIVPIFNRCVIFNTTSSSMHGNPRLVDHPRGLPRRSIALYYYTSTWSDSKVDHTTQFRTRRGSTDRPDWRVRTRELLRDVLPPVLYRHLKAIGR
jgi:hypothetical protein